MNQLLDGIHLFLKILFLIEYNGFENAFEASKSDHNWV